jgi:putative FmdB family regulatory protein
MPIFEYICKSCSTKFEILHKSSKNQDSIVCPDCKSNDIKKLLSVFSAGKSANSDFSGGCSGGSCGMPSYGGGCSSGMCGLN